MTGLLIPAFTLYLICCVLCEYGTPGFWKSVFSDEIIDEVPLLEFEEWEIAVTEGCDDSCFPGEAALFTIPE